jgi:thymidine phosphorylase
VESVDLITASILSKKLAAGLEGLVMDVKVGNGAFMATEAEALELANRIRDVGCGAGTPTSVLLTDMNQPLASCAGNALEVREALDFLQGKPVNARLREVTLELCAELLFLGQLARDRGEARSMAEAAVFSGRAAERFFRMVAALGGPADFEGRAGRLLPEAPCVREVVSLEAGRVCSVDTRSLGLAVVELGGGRRQPADAVDPAVGLSRLPELGRTFGKGDVLALVHARSGDDAERAAERVREAVRLGNAAVDIPPLVHGRLGMGGQP